MTQYEVTRDSLQRIVVIHLVSLAAPALALSLAVWIAIPWEQTPERLLSGVLVLFAAPLPLHFLWHFAFAAYRNRATEIARLRGRVRTLRENVERIYAAYPTRTKGAQFKVAFDLQGKSLAELEERLAVGMHREGKEVFVTAFMRRGVAVRVTAAIGSPTRCRPADAPSQWKYHIDRMQCDEVRQYHNHPVYCGRTAPSPLDFRSCATLKSLLCEHATKLRSFVLYWNEIGEWKLLEYDQGGRYLLAMEFDVAAA
ncbi:MAG: hypothetical protein WD872_02970 [Pirellulaceae bacterium]